MTAVLVEPVSAAVAADAAEVDAHEVDLRPRVQAVLRGGGLHRGSAGIAAQAQVLATLAESCMSTAFSFWGHRMAVEYLDRFGGPAQTEPLAALVTGERAGVSAMAASFRRHAQRKAGVQPAGLGITGRREGNEVVLEGFLPYASNLHTDAVLVLGAELTDPAGQTEDAILAIDADAPGIAISPARDLLALGSTRSGSVRLTGVRVSAEAVLPISFDTLTGAGRATFLTLQSAFCLGHARGSLALADATGTALAAEADELRSRQDALEQELPGLAAAAYAAEDIEPYLRLRIEAMHSAHASAHLALCVTGGRGYTRTHPVSRRLREAAFLPVQAPTKGQLLWELQSLSSTA